MKKLAVSFFIGFLVAIAVAVSIFYRPYEHYSMNQAYGTWYGVHEVEYDLLSAIYRLNENGTFEIDFARYNDGCELRSESTTMGVWGLDTSMFFMIEQKQKIKGKIESVNPNNRGGIYDAFKVLKLDENNFIFAREKPWLRRFPKFSKFQKFRTFRTKDALKRYFETDVSAQWSVCTNIIK